MTTEELKLWFSENKVLFVTNSMGLPGSTFLASLKTYIDYVPVHNFNFIPGWVKNQPNYGLEAFVMMIAQSMTKGHQLYFFDYIIYIDEDCFITDMNGLQDEFAKFIHSGCVIAGPQDGGVFCHRNHRSQLVNSFLSFWNLKIIRENTNIKDIATYCQKFNNPAKGYGLFLDYIRRLDENYRLYAEILEDSWNSVSEISSYRKKYFPNGQVPYAQIVKNDPENPTEPNQVPYSYEPDSYETNAEPYYALEEALIYLTKSKLYYLFATDYYSVDRDDETDDNSGLSSAVYTSGKEHKLIAVHTWFSRAYSKWPVHPVQKKHTARINKILMKYGKL